MSARHLFTILLMLLARAVAHGELQVGTPRWGFDGAVAKNTFNLLAVEVRNNGGSVFDGEIALDDRSAGRGSAPYGVRVFLAPGTTRWVQFFPYIGDYIPEWQLSWSDGKGTASPGIPASAERLKAGPPAVVILASLDDPTLRGTRISVFDEALFPPTVAATDSLHAVILDHQPKFDPARREAFLDWVRRGGIVHLLPGAEGTFPQFTGDYAPLNITGDTARVGAGLVARHATARSEISPQTLSGAGYPPPTLSGSDTDSWMSDPDRLFQILAGLTKPNIAWGFIYLLTVVYVVLIGPVFYLLRKRDYRLLLGGFVLTVGLFAWIFTVVGRRGYGEKQIYHSVGIARSLGGGRYDVQHWVHAFATSGDSYRLAYPGGGHLYAVSSRGDSVRASVVHGKDAAVLADIPLFSSRPFFHRGTLTGPDAGLAITDLQHPAPAPQNETSNARDLISKLAIRTDPSFPTTILRAAAEYRGRFYTLTRKGDTLTAAQPRPVSIVSALGSEGAPDQPHHFYRGVQAPEESRRALKAAAGFLATRVSNDPASTRKNTVLDPGPDTVRVFIYAEAPDEFRMANDQFQPGTEYVLYVHDLPVPDLEIEK